MSALLFGAANTDNATKTSPAGLTTVPTAQTLVAWIRPTTLVTNGTIGGVRGSTGGGFTVFQPDALGNLQASSSGNTATEIVTTNNTPMATVNKWYFIMYTSVFGTSSHIFVGGVNTLLTEATYGTNQRGVSQTSYAGTVGLVVGNSPTIVTRAFSGDIGPIAFFTQALTLAQGQYLQQHWWYALQLSNCVGLYLPGYEKASTCTDNSGSSNNLTISGATRDSGPAYNPSIKRAA